MKRGQAALAPVVHMLDSATHQINHHPVNKYEGNRIAVVLPERQFAQRRSPGH